MVGSVRNRVLCLRQLCGRTFIPNGKLFCTVASCPALNTCYGTMLGNNNPSWAVTNIIGIRASNMSFILPARFPRRTQVRNNTTGLYNVNVTKFLHSIQPLPRTILPAPKHLGFFAGLGTELVTHLLIVLLTLWRPTSILLIPRSAGGPPPSVLSTCPTTTTIYVKNLKNEMDSQQRH